MKVIGLKAYSRPEYLRRTLAALRACDGIREYVLFPQVDPGCDEVRAIVESIDFMESQPEFNAARLGSPGNTVAMARRAFDVTDYAIFLESDVILGADALRFYEWAGDRYRDDPGIASVTAYNRNPDPLPKGGERQVARRPWFHGLTFATWRNRWATVDRRIDVDRPAGWDVTVKREWVNRQGRKEVYPAWGRCNHVGIQTSVHDPATHSPVLMWQLHDAGFWASDPVSPAGQWHEDPGCVPG